LHLLELLEQLRRELRGIEERVFRLLTGRRFAGKEKTAPALFSLQPPHPYNELEFAAFV